VVIAWLVIHNGAGLTWLCINGHCYFPFEAGILASHFLFRDGIFAA